MRHIAILLALLLPACASTSSIVLPETHGRPFVAVLPVEGPLGAQASDLVSQELAQRGIATVERAKVVPYLALDTELGQPTPGAVQAYPKLGEALGVHYLFVGTVSAVRGPLYSFPHVNMTLRLIDVKSGETRWIGRYGNSLWTSAISEQGDLQRGASDIVDEFVKSGGANLLTQ